MKSSTKFVVTLVCFLCSFSFSSAISAQKGIGEEVVIFTKDRSIYSGELIADTESFLQVKIQTSDTLSIPRDKVRNILHQENYLFHGNGKSHKVTGFFWWVNAGLGSGFNHVYHTIEGELIVGKRINQRLAAGVAFGINNTSFDIDRNFADVSIASVAAHGRYYLTNKSTRIFGFSQIGFGIGFPNLYLSDQTGKQVKIQNGIGLHFASKISSRIVVSLAHNLQYLKGSTRVWTDANFFNSSEIRDFNFWSSNFVLKVGCEF